MSRICLRAVAGMVGLGLAAMPADNFAAEIVQSRSVPDTSDWNDPANWGGQAVRAGDTYVTAPFGAPEKLFTLDGTTWSAAGRMRDARTGSSTFGGDSLRVIAGTILIGKVEDGGVSSANVILDGGAFVHAGNGSSNGESGKLAGTIAFGENCHLAAIALRGSPRFTLVVASTIVGRTNDVLQLTTFGPSSTSHLDVTGDLSDFAGRIVVSTADGGVADGSSFSIQSSAPRATVELRTSSANFLYNLVTDVTFGSLIVDGKTLEPGIYGYAALDALAPGAFNDFGGTIAVGERP